MPRVRATTSDNSLATLLIAVSGLALAVASLTSQAATFVLSGSRVRAELRHGAKTSGSSSADLLA